MDSSLIIAQTKWKSGVLAIFCLAGISVSSYFLQKDFYSFTSEGHGEVLGEVVACDAGAKRKHSDSYLWSRLGQNQSVFLKDSIRVGPQGYATINLKDGTKLELGENSLVIIDDPKTLALKFVRGSFIVADGRGQRLVSVQKDGVALERELSVKLISPSPSARFLNQNQKPFSVTLHWAFKADVAAKIKQSARLLIGHDRQFQFADLTSQKVSELKNQQWTGALPAGRYYWKIMGGSENLSEVRDFTVLSLRPLVQISPAKDAVVSLYAGHLNVPFRWLPEASEKGASAQLDVSRTQTFTELVRSVEVDTGTGFAVVEGLPGGKYFWRLRRVVGGDAITSMGLPFTLSEHEKIEMALKEPNEGSAYEFGPELRFSWEAIEGNFDYQWEIDGPLGANAKVAKGGKTLTTKGSSILWQPEIVGQYRWRVMPYFAGAKAGESSWRPLSIIAAQPINLSKPEPQEKISFWDRKWKIAFQWQEQSGGEGKSYRLKIAEDIAFTKKLVVFTTTENEFEWTPSKSDDGGYRFWSVEWLGASQEVIRASSPRRFFFGMADILKGPMPKAPASDAEILLNDLVREPELSWEPLEKAIGYEITILRGGVAWQTKSSKDATLALKKLKVGKYSWTVRAIDILNRKGEFSAAQAFVVKQGAKLRAPTKTEWEVE